MIARRGELLPYVPRLLTEWLEQDPTCPYRLLQGTMVYIDLSGFTAMSERLARKGGKGGAEEVTEVLDTTFSSLLSVAYEMGGSLLKFGGDALLIFFTEPGHEHRACYAAAEMRRTLRDQGRISTSAGYVTLRMTAGLHSGEFDFFLAGSTHRELVVTGPSVTTTVEMESGASTGEVLVSAATASGLERPMLGRTKETGTLLKRTVPRPPALAAEMPRDPGGLEIFVPAASRDMLMSGDVESEHRPLTLAFIRFGGTDKLIRSGEAPRVADKLHGMMVSIQNASERHGVTPLYSDIDTDGGKVLLASGVPSTYEDNEERLLRTVREIFDGDNPLPLQAGLHRGHAFTGAIGPPYRKTFTVMGDAVNTAARVMAHAAPGEILATASVLDRSRTLFEVGELAPFSAKGKAKPILAFRVGAVAGSRDMVIGELPLLGREKEIAFVRPLLQAACEGKGSVVIVEGEPGIGKSRFIGEIKRLAEGMREITVECEQYESSTPYFAVRRLMRALLEIPEGSEDKEGRQSMEEQIRTIAPEETEWLPLLAPALGIEMEMSDGIKTLDPQVASTRRDNGLMAILSAGLSAPSLLIFEDVHWMDTASAGFLEQLISNIGEHPWVVCIARRPGESGFVPEGTLHDLIELSPLDRESAVELASAVAGTLLPHQARAFADSAGGNPLFLRELVAYSKEGEGIEGLPETVEALIGARIDHLSLADRRTLRALSVLGPRFDPQMAEIVTVERPDWAILASFVERGANEIAFRHDLIQQVAYEGLTFKKRRRLHGSVAEAVEAATERPEDQAETLSLHFLKAQHYDKAWHYAVSAGDRAKQAFAFVPAAIFYERATEAGSRIKSLRPSDVARVWQSLGDVYRLTGRTDRVQTAYRRARLLVKDDPIRQADLLRVEGLLRAEVLGEFSAAMRWYRRALRTLHDYTNAEAIELRGEIEMLIGALRFRQGRYKESFGWCRRAVEDATATGAIQLMARAHQILHLNAVWLRDENRVSLGQRALELAQKIGDKEGEASVLMNLGVDAYYEGDWSKALDLYERARGVFEDIGKVDPLANAATNIGEILLDQGNATEARSYFDRALSTFTAVGHGVSTPAVRGYLGLAAMRMGDLDEADRLLEGAISDLNDLGAVPVARAFGVGLVELRLLQERLEEAEVAATRLLRENDTSIESQLTRLIGHIKLREGDLSAARTHFGKSFELADERGARFERALALEALAAVTDDVSQASEYGREAREIFDYLGVVSSPNLALIGTRSLERYRPPLDGGL